MKAGSNQAKTFREQLASDIEHAPDYKTEMALAESYYDSLQLPTEVKEFMEARGQPVIINNLIQPVVNGILGMEAKTRTDFQVRADDDQGTEIAEALNERLNEEVRICRVHRANSDAFKREVIGGLGWVEVRRNTDPFGDKYIVEDVDWREVHYDWRSTRPDLSDARYLARERWVDIDMLKVYFPRHKELIERVHSGEGLEALVSANAQFNVMPDLVGPNTTELQSQYDRFGGVFINQERRQARITHVQYRVPRRGYVLRMGERVIEFDKHNPVHVAAYRSGRAMLRQATFTAIRHAWFFGGHLLHDMPSPYPHNKFSLVPFWGFREGGTRKPYGIVRNLIPAQDEVNFRRSMITWLLKARMVIKDEDAVVESDADLKQSVDSVDGIVNLNPNRKNARTGDGGFRIHTETGVAGDQFRIMQDSMKQIQDLAGVYSAFLGQEGGAQSGIAINSLVEQATVTMSDMFDNYQFGRQHVGDLMLSLIEADIGENETTVYAHVNQTRPTKKIIINQREQSPEGKKVITNRLAQLRRHIVLADVQSSPGYRAQQLQQLMELAATLPDKAKLVILEDIIELTELPKKGDIINKVKQAIGMGVNPDDMSEQEKQEYAQKQQQMQKEMAMQLQERQAKIANDQADAKKKQADAAYTERRTQAMDSQESYDEARAAKVLSEINKQDVETAMQKNAAAEQLEGKIQSMLAQL